MCATPATERQILHKENKEQKHTDSKPQRREEYDLLLANAGQLCSSDHTRAKYELFSQRRLEPPPSHSHEFGFECAVERGRTNHEEVADASPAGELGYDIPLI